VLRDFTEAYSSKGISEEEGEGAKVGAVRMTPAIAATSPDTLFRTIELLNTALSSFEMTVPPPFLPLHGSSVSSLCCGGDLCLRF
jgi:hypothetical protein